MSTSLAARRTLAASIIIALLLTTSVLAQANPRTFLSTTLDLIEHRAYRAASIDWPTVRRQALIQAEHARTTSDVYPVITAVLAQLDDHHSYLLPAPPKADVAQPQVFAGMHIRSDEHTIDQVDVGSPADDVGIKAGDVITDVKPGLDGSTMVLTVSSGHPSRANSGTPR